MSSMTITPLDAALGAEVRGCDITAGLEDEAFSRLVEALTRHLVLVIRGQSLEADTYLRFGRRWGRPIPHVLDHMRMQGYPEMMTVGNTEVRDRDPKIRNGAALWHTDQSYEQIPASATMLYSIIAPSQGGETQFCNMHAAYEALAPEQRERIDGLRVAHKYGRGRTAPDEPPVNPIINDDQDARVPVVYHPLVLVHPLTGSRALYALGHGAHGIEGMDDDEAVALLEELKSHCRQERFIYRHPYAVGDLVIWDTLQTMHRATPIEIPEHRDEARLLWRISVRGGDDTALRPPAAA